MPEGVCNVIISQQTDPYLDYISGKPQTDLKACFFFFFFFNNIGGQTKKLKPHSVFKKTGKTKKLYIHSPYCFTFLLLCCEELHMTMKRRKSMKSFQVIIQKKNNKHHMNRHCDDYSVLHIPAEYKKLVHCNCFSNFILIKF